MAPEHPTTLPADRPVSPPEPPTGPRSILSHASTELHQHGQRHSSLGVRFTLRTSGVEAWVRLLIFVVRAVSRHGFGALTDRRLRETREPRRRKRRDKSVAELVTLLGQLKGAFVKAGQFASVRHDLLPAAASDALASLQSQVPALPLKAIREVVESELGSPIETLFQEFDPEPLGAASVAQVHRARLPSGELVAVKVQYPWVARSLSADIACLGLLLRGFARWRGVEIPDAERLLSEFGQGLREELDFVKEGEVASEIAANLETDPQVAVPTVLRHLSSTRVLTMSYCETISIRDTAVLDRRQISRRAVLEVLGRAYAKQIFADGLFHADPHPGNLFVVDEPTAAEKPRILFVDFGLSKRLSPELRGHLRQAFYALLRSDLAAFVDEMEAMGMISDGARDGVEGAVEAMFARIRAQGGGLAVPGSAILGLKDEAKELLRNTPGLQLPNDLLLYARTLTYLFALGEELDPDVDLLKLSTPYLLKFLAAKD